MTAGARDRPVEDHGGLLLYRLWHPTSQLPTAVTFRWNGPRFRFDPHTDAVPPADDPHRQVWYGGETFETAVREVLDRDPRPNAVVEVCRRNRISAVRLPSPTRLLDLTAHAARLGVDDLGIDDDLADDPGVDYAITQRLARELVDTPGVDGLRYHSARHRDRDGSRTGVNVVLWQPRDLQLVGEVALRQPGAWRRVLTILDRARVAPVRVPACRRCLS